MLLFFKASLEKKTPADLSAPLVWCNGASAFSHFLVLTYTMLLEVLECVQRWAVELEKGLEHKEKSLENF